MTHTLHPNKPNTLNRLRNATSTLLRLSIGLILSLALYWGEMEIKGRYSHPLFYINKLELRNALPKGMSLEDVAKRLGYSVTELQEHPLPLYDRDGWLVIPERPSLLSNKVVITFDNNDKLIECTCYY